MSGACLPTVASTGEERLIFQTLEETFRLLMRRSKARIEPQSCLVCSGIGHPATGKKFPVASTLQIEFQVGAEVGLACLIYSR